MHYKIQFLVKKIEIINLYIPHIKKYFCWTLNHVKKRQKTTVKVPSQEVGGLQDLQAPSRWTLNGSIAHLNRSKMHLSGL